MDYAFHDIVGNIGVATIVGMYALLQFNKIQSRNFWYSFANGLGALLIIISLLYKPNTPAIILQTGWLIVSVIGIVVHFKAKHNKTQS